MLEVKRELEMTRLLTITGAGGSGKTRLALEVSRDPLETYSTRVLACVYWQRAAKGWGWRAR
jgi:predicted ATPase